MSSLLFQTSNWKLLFICKIVNKIIFELHAVPVVDSATVIGRFLGTKVHLEIAILSKLEKNGLLRSYVLTRSLNERLHLKGIDIYQIYRLISSTQDEWELFLEERNLCNEIFLDI